MSHNSEPKIILDIVNSISSAIRALPGRGSSKLEQKRQGGHLFPMATALTYYVLWGLDRFPEDYPDLVDRASPLREAQERADAWHDLEALAEAIRYFARMNYLREQSLAITLAKGVLDRVRRCAENADLLPAMDHDNRVTWLRPAFRLLYRQLQHPILARKARAAALQATGAQTESARARAGKAAKKAEANAALLDLFGQILRGHGAE